MYEGGVLAKVHWIDDANGKSSLTVSSKAETPIPLAAPDPASPMKWPEPMLEANSEAPT